MKRDMKAYTYHSRRTFFSYQYTQSGRASFSSYQKLCSSAYDPAHQGRLLTERGARLQLGPDLHIIPLDNGVPVIGCIVPLVLLFQCPTSLSSPVIVVPADLVDAVQLSVVLDNRLQGRRLYTNIIITTRMVWLSLNHEGFQIFHVFIAHQRGSLKPVHKQARAPLAIGMGQQMEQLESSWVSEICIIGVSSKEFRRISGILEGQVCREVPESTYLELGCYQ